MKEKSRKVKKKKIAIIIVIIGMIFLGILVQKSNEKETVSEQFRSIFYSAFLPETKNKQYSGKGQQEASEKDGYTTTFITKREKEYKEYKQNGKSSWAKNSYWGATMEENGCGITCMAILGSGYGKDITPEDLRKKYTKDESHLGGEEMSKEIKKELKLNNTGFYYESSFFTKKKIWDSLEEDKPVLICVWDKPNHKWTTASHYMLLLATDGKDKVYVSNPNGLDGQEKMSGWYSSQEVLPYIAKVMYILS